MKTPTLALRRKFEKASSARSEKTLPQTQRIALTIPAWNAYSKGLPGARLLWFNGPFPKIDGIQNISPADVGCDEKVTEAA